MKALLIGLLILLSFLSVEATALIEKGAAVAVMDFGTHQGTSDPDFNLIKAEQATSEYVIDRLVKNNYFNVIDKDTALDKLRAENLNITGLIDPDTAKRIGEILNVNYIVYGNVTNVGLDENVEAMVRVKTVKAHIVIRIMDVRNGRILMAAEGTGKSKSSSIMEETSFIRIGNVKVSQTSVHNALKKSAFQAVDILVKRLQC